MLTSRQINIIKNLKAEKKHITVKELSRKYEISQRTIRYDLDNIEQHLSKYEIKIEKKPRVGIFIESKEGLEKVLMAVTSDINENLIYSSKDRNCLILLNIIFSNTNITSDALADILKISRSTILTSIKEINTMLKNENVLVKGKQYYGYILDGTEEDIRSYFSSFIGATMESNNGKAILENAESFFDETEKKLIAKVVKDMRNRFDLKLYSEKQERIFELIIGFWIKRLKYDQKINYSRDEIFNHRNTLAFKNCEDIYYGIISELKLDYRLEEVVYLNRVILLKTNNEKLMETSYDGERLNEVVNSIVSVAYETLNIKDEEVETLISELMSHLKMTINRCKLNINVENSILEQIKVKYGDVFKIAKEAVKVFEVEYDVKLSDDEIGFITMYFCKSLESSKIRIKKNVIVVCNSSRGTSKLLAARIKNNIPEINVKRIVSVADIKDSLDELDDIDLIISTIKLKNINKAHIVVNPIITMYNLAQIRDFIYINNTIYEAEEIHEDFEESLSKVIRKYSTDIKEGDKLYEEVLNLIPYYINLNKSDLENESKYVEKVALMLVEIFDMISKLFKDEIDEELLRKICGVTLHVFMAIPRWKAKEFNEEKEKDIVHYKDVYKSEYKVVEEAINNISKKNNFAINSSEIISIIRYLL